MLKRFRRLLTSIIKRAVTNAEFISLEQHQQVIQQLEDLRKNFQSELIKNDIRHNLLLRSTEQSLQTTQSYFMNFIIEWQHRYTFPFSKLANTDTAANSLISVIMPTRNAAAVIEKAIQSVLNQTYKHWELIISDAGSSDNTQQLVMPYLTDKRIRFYHHHQTELAVACNAALSHSQGNIIAYLTPDHTWFTYYLESVAKTFQQYPDYRTIYLARATKNRLTNILKLEYLPEFNFEDALQTGGISLNVFAHHSELVHELGQFDTTLSSVANEELILRYTAKHPPLNAPLIGAYSAGNLADYTTDSSDNFYYRRHLMSRQWLAPINQPLRVLYIVKNYPQLSESYVDSEAKYFLNRGVQIEIWSQVEKPAAKFSLPIKIHNGSLADAITQFQPHLLHVHWLTIVDKWKEQLNQFSIPITVRAHSFDYSQDRLHHQIYYPWLSRIYIYPHFAQSIAPSDKIAPTPVAFDASLFYPTPKKNRKRVLRTGAGLLNKGIEIFIRIAKECPDFEFVLVVAEGTNVEENVKQFLSQNAALGNPVKIHVNMVREQVAELMRDTSIYMHTHGTYSHAFGMPISIAEAQATGCYVIAGNFPSAKKYLSGGGDTYNTDEEAIRLIYGTLQWTDEQWQHKQQLAIANAYANYVDSKILEPILKDWQMLISSNISLAAKGKHHVDAC